MEKRFVIAIALVFLILFIWPLLFRGTGPTPVPSQQQEREAAPKDVREVEPPKPTIPAKVLEGTFVTVRTPLYEVQFATDGARAVHWKLRDYLKRGEKPKPIFALDAQSFQSDLDNNSISGELRRRFEKSGIRLSEYVTVTIEKEDSKWLISDKQIYTGYIVSKKGDMLNVHEPEYVDLIPQNRTPRADKKWLAMQFPGDVEIQDEMENAQWTPDKELVTVEDVEGAQDSIEFTYTMSAGIVVFKRMKFFRDSYFVDVDIGFHNPSLEAVGLDGYNLCWGGGLAKDEQLSDAEVAGEGPMALLKTEKGPEMMKHWHRTGFACFGGKHRLEPVQEGPISWVAFASKYFVAALIPGPESWWSNAEEKGKRYAVITDVKDTVLPAVLPPKEVWREWGHSTTVALVWPKLSIPAGGTVLHEYRVYTGPKKWDILREIERRGDSTESLMLGKLINFGMFSPLGKATLWLLMLFYRVGNNYGVALILLTVLIKILYLPLTQKSFKSMKKMQELQPKIAALKEKFRDDPQRLNKETMKFYKRHGANPMGGCLPLLFQMPVFWALFATLRGAVEMRGAMFIPGWVTDLSLPDTVAVIADRFPLRILPLLMTGSMLLQQLLFGSGGQGQGNKMMAFMPLFFMFIFYGMPSGLVLYWLCNNILAVGHQYLIRRQEGGEIEDQEENKDKKTNKTGKGNRT